MIFNDLRDSRRKVTEKHSTNHLWNVSQLPFFKSGNFLVKICEAIKAFFGGRSFEEMQVMKIDC